MEISFVAQSYLFFNYYALTAITLTFLKFYSTIQKRQHIPSEFHIILNPFVPNAPFLDPHTSENRKDDDDDNDEDADDVDDDE